jgi:hypothetical protein
MAVIVVPDVGSAALVSHNIVLEEHDVEEEFTRLYGEGAVSFEGDAQLAGFAVEEAAEMEVEWSVFGVDGFAVFHPIATSEYEEGCAGEMAAVDGCGGVTVVFGSHFEVDGISFVDAVVGFAGLGDGVIAGMDVHGKYVSGLDGQEIVGEDVSVGTVGAVNAGEYFQENVLLPDGGGDFPGSGRGKERYCNEQNE